MNAPWKQEKPVPVGAAHPALQDPVKRNTPRTPLSAVFRKESAERVTRNCRMFPAPSDSTGDLSDDGNKSIRTVEAAGTIVRAGQFVRGNFVSCPACDTSCLDSRMWNL
ncbi:MAG TPA: hypothetical protein EYG03_05420 [Planctomycetes bacterium]|nr:hypothetical protein [Fuerstiella sp.]HIK91412.1 hypothetical protein [Planctomycetota bacterium]